ncbi:TMV resistance protein N-like [Pyrus ussuriensis x Pyrus communis]|uniref:TMV resistance protein N-like n=1 Tax=Pyrus ussuriensis x Pyrus communis TaxID=2448454 RepID=A0A5N5HHY9_9ROSA|nr:TMV resistance protein N-like [Pyrus ussuriensis x Pyrus communis]
MSIEVSNKSKGLKWLYGLRFYGGPGGRGEDVTWLSHWKMDNQTIILECGDEVVVSEFGVELVQEHQDKMSTQHNTTPDPNDPFVIGGDLSPLENVSGEYEFCWFSEAEMKNTDFCRPKWLNTLIMDSDKEEEQQSDLDHKIAAASARGNNCHPGGWRGLVTAAVFLLTLTQIVRPSISQKKKRQ